MTDKFLEKALKYASHFEISCGVDCNIYDLNKYTFTNKAPKFCRTCCHRYGDICNCDQVHHYGCLEAERWGGRYTYYCSMGLVFLAAYAQSKQKATLGFVAGPIIMGESDDVIAGMDANCLDTITALPAISTERVYHIAETLGAFATCLRERDVGFSQTENSLELLNMMYENSEVMRNTGKYIYPIEMERNLQHMISKGDKEGAQKMLNRLLSYINFSSDNGLKSIKARATELIVLFSRAAVDGGADINQILWYNEKYFKRLDSFNNFDEMSVWLSETLQDLISSVIDFTKIKHVDVIYKAINYIKNHYTERITLEDVARHVCLSKSYFSKMFADELGCTLIAYINNMRIETSKQILLDNSISLVDVATLVGFVDQSYFTKVFKKAVGVSPRKYREARGKI